MAAGAGNVRESWTQKFDFLLRYYVRSLDDHYNTSVHDPLQLFSFPGFDLEKTTVFYIYGFLEDVTWLHIRTVVPAYLDRGDHNVVVVDWSNLNKPPYLTNGAPNAIRVGRILGQTLQILVKTGMNPSRIHLVGHSLGGQAASFAAKELPFKISRITGLDAANPGFYGLEYHLTASDAQFVDNIHTDAGIYGAGVPTAKADFWPNGGIRLQPGCYGFFPFFAILSEQDSCSHWRSWMYWAESLRNEKAFPARRCEVNLYSRGNDRMQYLDEGSEEAYMGYAASKNLNGNYCLVTRSKSPFGLGTSTKGIGNP